ncbi:hypothetical protein LTR08_004931 [Meristemomyces frigidus]|nr:hypothetical protein LTR08_004931 [Meristemomyces frigidus]
MSNQRQSHDFSPALPTAITLHAPPNSSIDKYPSKSHAHRLAAQLHVTNGLVVLAATPAATYPDSDQPVPFRQDRYFYYLTGCDEPGCYVTYDIGKDVLTLWLPAIDEKRVVWTGRGSTVEEAVERYDVDEARYIHGTGAFHSSSAIRLGLPQYLEAHLRQCWNRAAGNESCNKNVYVLSPERVNSIYNPSSPETPLLASASRTLEASRTELKNAINACRTLKDPHEIALIRRANAITAAAHTAVLRNISTYTNEAQVEALYTATCIAQHAKQQAYSPIAGAGPNASVLHYGANDEDFGSREVLVLDAGCEWHCYASDVTRAIPLNTAHPGEWASAEAAGIYKLVETVQEACIAAMEPGASFLGITYMARRMTVDGLLALGILKGDKEAIWKAGTVMGFFPHGLGHHLGLEVHDVSPVAHPPASSLTTCITTSSPEILPYQLPRSFNFPLPTSSSSHSPDPSLLHPGMVITIEPGIYFNRFLLEHFFLSNPTHSPFIDREVLDRYWRVGGVRIEDDILVTGQGYENLTTALKGRGMREAIRGGKGGEGGEGDG